MHILNKSSPKVTTEPGNIKSDKSKGLRMIKRMSKFKVSNKECFMDNGITILKTAAELAKIVPYLDTIINLSMEIMKIHERAKYNEKICRLMADRVDLAMTSIKLLRRHVNDDNNKFRRQTSYHNALVHFIAVLENIKIFVSNISGKKGLKQYFIANVVTNQFNEIRDDFDHAYKALQLAISIEQFISRDKEDNEFKLELEEFNRHCETINNMEKNISALTEMVERVMMVEPKDNKNKLLDNLRPPEIHCNEISDPDSPKFHENIEMRKYKNLDVACKKIKAIQGDTPESKKIRATLSIWNKLHECPNVIKFYGISKLDIGDCLILEWSELNNLKNVYENHKLSWEIKLEIARDVFRGLGILHHDVRAENMLVTNNRYTCKISNFNLSREVNTESREITDVLQMIRWMAPEKLKKCDNPYNYSCEMYSFGMFLWELSFNRIPYDNIDSEQIEEYVLNGNRETLKFEKGPSDIIEGFTEIITSAWQDDHRIRPKDPGVTKIFESLAKSRSTNGNSPMIPFEQNKVTSLEIPRNISDTENVIEYDENLDLILEDDDDEEVVELLTLNEGMNLHSVNKNSRTKEQNKICWDCFNAHAEFGDKTAIYWKAYYLWEGYHVETDKEEAIKLYKIAADAGNADAQLNYAFAIRKSDRKIFMEYLTKAAENENKTALYHLGDIYYQNKSKNKKEKGIKYLKLAALKGYPKAIESLQQR
ncbi:19762_t:CDS:2, partial [Funneliformis geosporum]